MSQSATRDRPARDTVEDADSSTRVGADPLWTGVLRALRSHPGTALAVSVAVAGLTVTVLRGPPDAERLAAFEREMEDHLAGDELGALSRTTDGQANVLDSRLFRTTPTALVDDQLRR